MGQFIGQKIYRRIIESSSIANHVIGGLTNMNGLRELMINTIDAVKNKQEFRNEDEWMQHLHTIADLLIDEVAEMDRMFEEVHGEKCDAYENMNPEEEHFHLTVDNTFTKYMMFMEKLIADKDIVNIERLGQHVGLLIDELEDPNHNIPNTILEAFEEKDNE